MRYTLLLDEPAVKGIERLQAAWHLKNKADVYDLAVRVLTWATDQRAKGCEVGRYLEEKEEFHPLLIPHDLNVKAWREGALAR